MRHGIRRAFSLIELVVVITVIVLIVAIVLPALGSARNAARVADTRNLVANLSQAMALYKQDKNRLPGYFSQAEMASADNSTRGFSQMQNVMIDLAGGIDTTGAAGAVSVGPLSNTARQVKIDPKKVGVKQGSQNIYFSPNSKYFALQDGTENGQRFGVPEHGQIAELVDTFGTPILMWMADDAATGVIDSITANNGSPFVLEQYAASAAGARARFYRNTNKAFLEPNIFVGKQRVDQGYKSLLGTNSTTPLLTLGAMLGNPASPQDTTRPIDQILPSAARGTFVIQSAGADAAYLKTYSKGAKMHGITAENGPIQYGKNFKVYAGTNLTDDGGKPISIDFMSDFDDVIQAGD